MQVQITTHILETISTRTIRDLGEVIRRSSVNLDTLLAPPAGKNREYMRKPIVEMTTALANEFEDLRISFRVGIDTTELRKVKMSDDQVASFPGFLRYKEQLGFSPRVKLFPKLQEETNSVVECLTALREIKDHNPLSSLVLPRDMNSLCNRIKIGLRPYLQEFESDIPQKVLLVKVPMDAESLLHVRILTESCSAAATKMVSLVGPKVLQDYLEKKGLVGRLMRGLQQLKLKILPRK